MEHQNIHQSKRDSQKPKNIWSGCFTVILFITNLLLLLLFLNTHVDLNYAKGKYDAARDTINNKNKEITSLETEIEEFNSSIVELNSEIDSLESKISSLNEIKIARVDIVNKNCRNTFIFLNERLTAGTGPGGNTYFYTPPGTYTLQQCSEPHKANCGDKISITVETVYTINVFKRSYCP